MDSLKITIIDDDSATCSLLKTILEMDNHQIAVADKIENDDIIALLDQEQPDFLILDYHLKGMNTLKFVRIIRGSAVWQHLAILMISAVDYDKACREAGANGFVLKPFDWQEIPVMVNKISSEVFER